jgi:oligoribonuclease NrnB/cAMP/cGMP phosphodiesterase (DHH superfamily)
LSRPSTGTLTWDFFHGRGSGTSFSHSAGPHPPLLFRYLEDKDIWRWALRDSEAFSAGFGTVKFEFAVFDALLARGEAGVDEIIERGRAILEYKNGVRDSHVKRAVACRLRAAPQFRALIVNGSTIASEVGHAMCEQPGVQVGVIWTYDHKTRSIYVSLRSDSDDVDVSAIAKGLGGGGHKRAAGFTYLGASIEDLLLPAEEAPAEQNHDALAALTDTGAKRAREQ